MFTNLYEKILAKEEKISLVGLGYVGMPIAVAFAKKVDVIGYDYNAAKIDLYKNGIDPTNEVGNDVIANTTVQFTNDPAMLRQAKFHIVAVPTPVNDDHTPDLFPVESASKILGRNLTPGEEKYAQSWLDMGFDEEAIAMAYERTCINTGGLKWPYMNSILKRWHDAGLHTADQVRAGDSKAQPKQDRRDLSPDELDAIRRMVEEE